MYKGAEASKLALEPFSDHITVAGDCGLFIEVQDTFETLDDCYFAEGAD